MISYPEGLEKEMMAYCESTLLEYIDEETASKMVQLGARLIDVRGKNEFKADAIEGAMNIPLSMLRNRAASLNPSRKYVVYCDSGNRSSAAAFLMCQLGFQCSVIESGMTSCDKLLRPKENELPTQSSATAETESRTARLRESIAAVAAIKTIATPKTVDHNQVLEITATTIQKAPEDLTELHIPTLNDDEINLIKSKAEQEFSDKLEKERKTALSNAKQIENNYQEKLEQERKKASQAEYQIKKAAHAEKAIHEKLQQERKKVSLVENQNKKFQDELANDYQEKLLQERAKSDLAASEIKVAQNEIERIKKEALTIREHSQLELDRYKNELETERQRIENELKRSKKEATKRVKVEKKILEKQEKAEAEVQIAKQQISNIKSDAQHEIEDLRAELLLRKKEQQSLEHKRLEAEEKSNRANKLLQQVKQQASSEIDDIRSKVLQEKSELENEIKKHRQETEIQLQKNTAIATKAQQDAENAVLQLRAELEEKNTQNIKLEEQERKTKDIAEKLAIEAEEARLTAEMEAAHFRAEADSIREQAKSEANKLKNEIESSRRLMHEQAKIAQAEAEQARLIRQQAEEEQRLADQEKITSKAKKQAADARNQIEIEIQQAKQLAKETEVARIAKAEAEAFERTRLETELLAKRNAEEATRRAELQVIQIEKEHAEEQERHLAQIRAQERANATARKAQQLAKQRAAQIAATLQKKAQPEIDSALQENIHSDISLAKSTISEDNGRIILEGENDIFVFQRPDPEEIIFEEHDDDDNIPVLDAIDQISGFEGATSINITADDDLFDFEETNNSNNKIFAAQTNIVTPAEIEQPRNTTINNPANFNPTDSVALTSNTFLQTNGENNSTSFKAKQFLSNKKLPRNKTFTLITTTTVFIIAFGIFSAANETFLNFDKVLAWLEPSQQVVVEETETRRLSRIAAAQSRAELNVKENAASEFKTMLEKWKDSVELGPDN